MQRVRRRLVLSGMLALGAIACAMFSLAAFSPAAHAAPAAICTNTKLDVIASTSKPLGGYTLYSTLYSVDDRNTGDWCGKIEGQSKVFEPANFVGGTLDAQVTTCCSQTSKKTINTGNGGLSGTYYTVNTDTIASSSGTEFANFTNVNGLHISVSVSGSV